MGLSLTLTLCPSLSSTHSQQPGARCLHHSARTPQQPYAIREEPTAAILINIDLVSTYPSGSVRNSRYCISTATANTTHGQYGQVAAAKLTTTAIAGLQDPRCCHGKCLISSCNKSIPGGRSPSTVKHLSGLVDFPRGCFLFGCDTWRNWASKPTPELWSDTIK